MYYGNFVLQCLWALIAPLISRRQQQFNTCVPQDYYVPSVSAGASAVYVRRNLLFFQLRSLLINESLAFSMFTSSPTQNTSQAALTRHNGRERRHYLQIPITPPQESQRIWNMISCTLSRTAVSSSRWCLAKHLENYTFTTEGCLGSEKVLLFYWCCCGCTETGNHTKWCQKFPNAWQDLTFNFKVKPNQTQHLCRCRSYVSWLSLCTQDKYLEV